MVLTFAATTTDSGADNHKALFGLVTETVRLVGTGGTIARQNVGTLTVFPGATVICCCLF